MRGTATPNRATHHLVVGLASQQELAALNDPKASVLGLPYFVPMVFSGDAWPAACYQ